MTDAPATHRGTAVTVSGVTHGFGDVAVLDDVSLQLPAGGFVAMVGPSGCGKSTLLKVLAGLLVPDAGDARIGERSVVGRPGGTAYMAQRDLLLPWRRTLGNATVGAEVAGVPRAEAAARARALLARFGLEGFEDAWPAELSGGMRQRLALLRTFLVGSDVLLLDEPFGALDAITRRDMHAWLQEVLTDDPRTVLLVTHDVDEALVLADRVVILSDRPAAVVADLDVDLPRPRGTDTVTDPSFTRAKAELLAALEAGRRAA